MATEKTWAWFREQFLGVIIGVCVSVAFYFFVYPCGDTKELDEIVSKTVDVSFIIFGFVLAFLGLIMQAQEKLKELLGSDIVFNRLVKYCVRIISIAVILGVGGFVYWILEKLKLPICVKLNRLVFVIMLGGLVWLFYNMVYFVKIFYMIIKSTSSTQNK